MGGILGGGYGSQARQASQQQGALAQQQAQMGAEQWGDIRPLIQLWVQQQMQQGGAAMEYLPGLLAYTLSRLTGAQGLTGSVPEVQPEPGPADVGGVLGLTVSPAGDVVPRAGRPERARGTHPGGGYATQFPGTQQPGLPSPARGQQQPSTPAPAPVATAPAIPQPVWPVAGAGPYGSGAEQQAWERSRTDIERAQRAGSAQLQQTLGQRFGSSGAAGSLMAGAQSELASRTNEANIAARLGIAEQQRAVEAERYAQIAALVGSLMGLNIGPAIGAGQTAMGGLASAGNLFGQQAQWAAQQQAQQNQGLAGLLAMIGGGAFGGMPTAYIPGTAGTPYFTPPFAG